MEFQAQITKLDRLGVRQDRTVDDDIAAFAQRNREYFTK